MSAIIVLLIALLSLPALADHLPMCPLETARLSP